MGTDIYLRGQPTAPHNISTIGAEIWGKMKPQRMFPDGAMTMLEAKAPTKLYATASVYRPTATVRHANKALLVQCWKHIMGMPRHAHTKGKMATWGSTPHSWQVGTAQEWVRAVCSALPTQSGGGGGLSLPRGRRP